MMYCLIPNGPAKPEQEYKEVHDFYRARVELPFACLWSYLVKWWRTVVMREYYKGQFNHLIR